jgi:hypothetical protein
MSLKLSLNTILLSPMLHEGGKVVLCILPAYEVPSEFFQEFPCIFEGVVREAAAADSSSDGIDGAPFAPSSAPGMMATMAVIIYSQEIIYYIM